MINNRRAIKFSVRDDNTVDMTMDDDVIEASASADHICVSKDFLQSIKSHRKPIDSSIVRGKKTNLTAIMRTDSGNFELTLEDAKWVIDSSNPNSSIAKISIVEPTNLQLITEKEYIINVTGRLFHSLQPRCWLYDEILNAAAVLLRIYCKEAFSTREYVIADIDFYRFYTANIDLATKHEKVLKCYFIDKEVFQACKNMLIPIYIHGHFVLAAICFHNSTIYYMDSLHKSGEAILKKLNSYGKYLRSFFLDDNDDIDFAFVELKKFIPHQGNGYDCGCHVIWNMIQYICGIESYRVIPANIRQIIALWILSKDHSVVFSNL